MPSMAPSQSSSSPLQISGGGRGAAVADRACRSTHLVTPGLHSTHALAAGPRGDPLVDQLVAVVVLAVADLGLRPGRGCSRRDVLVDLRRRSRRPARCTSRPRRWRPRGVALHAGAVGLADVDAGLVADPELAVVAGLPLEREVLVDQQVAVVVQVVALLEAGPSPATMEASVAASCFSSPTKKALRVPLVRAGVGDALSWACSAAQHREADHVGLDPRRQQRPRRPVPGCPGRSPRRR